MLTIKDLQHKINQAYAAGLSEASEVRFVSHQQQPFHDCSLSERHTVIEPDQKVPPADRRYGDGVLMLAHEQVMREAPVDVLKRLDMRL
jgi:hypothetical protein